MTADQFFFAFQDVNMKEEFLEEDYFFALYTKYNHNHKLKQQDESIHIASSIDTSVADCSA